MASVEHTKAVSLKDRKNLLQLLLRISPWVFVSAFLLGFGLFRYHEGLAFERDLRQVRQLEKNSVALYFSGLDLKAALMDRWSNQVSDITPSVDEAIARLDGQLAVAETQLLANHEVPALPPLRRTFSSLKTVGVSIMNHQRDDPHAFVEQQRQLAMSLLTQWFHETDALSASAQTKITQLDQELVQLQRSNVIMFAGMVLATLFMLFDISRMWVKAQDAQAKREAVLSELAHLDPLTSVLNRRGWDEQTHRVRLRCVQSGVPMALVMLDLDHFKRFNDQHGHAAGDLLLKQFTNELTQRSRPGDIIARLGGEEFALALPGCDADMAYRQIERIRRDSLLEATFSAGVVALEPGMSVNEALTLADAALYAAKNQGRARSVVHLPQVNILPQMV